MKKLYSILIIFILILTGCNQESNNKDQYTVTSTSTSYSGVLKSSKTNTFPIVEGMVLNVVNGQNIEEGNILFSTMDKQAKIQYETSVSERNYTQQDLEILLNKINDLTTKLNNEIDEIQKQTLTSEIESLKEQEINLKRSIQKQDSIIQNIKVQEQILAPYSAQVKVTDQNITIESTEKQAIISLSNVLINDFNKDISYKLLLDNKTYELSYQSEVFNQTKSNDTQAYYDIAFNIINPDDLRNGYPIEIKSTIEKIYVPNDYVIEKDDKFFVVKDGNQIEIKAIKVDSRFEVINGLKANDIIDLPIKENNDKTSWYT